MRILSSIKKDMNNMRQGLDKTEALINKLSNGNFPAVVLNVNLTQPKPFVTDYYFDTDSLHKGTLDFIKVRVVGESYSKVYPYSEFIKDYVEYSKKYVALHFPDWEP
jgi:hypothetical protein